MDPTAHKPVAWIIGGANRIGRSIAIEFARAGCDVAVTYKRSVEDAQKTAEECKRLGAAACTFRLELNDLSTVPLQVQNLTTSLSRCDILVLSASTYESTPLNKVTAESLLSMFTINAASHGLIVQSVAPLLQASRLRGGGSIVAMLDVHATGTPRRHHLAYSMSKAALTESVRSLALELAPSVRVNGVAIGVAAWPATGPESDPEMQARYLNKVPLGRAGTPEEAATAVRFLALDATYTTGHILTLDGGRSLT